MTSSTPASTPQAELSPERLIQEIETIITDLGQANVTNDRLQEIKSFCETQKTQETSPAIIQEWGSAALEIKRACDSINAVVKSQALLAATKRYEELKKLLAVKKEGIAQGIAEEKTVRAAAEDATSNAQSQVVLKEESQRIGTTRWLLAALALLGVGASGGYYFRGIQGGAPAPVADVANDGGQAPEKDELKLRPTTAQEKLALGFFEGLLEAKATAETTEYFYIELKDTEAMKGELAEIITADQPSYLPEESTAASDYRKILHSLTHRIDFQKFVQELEGNVTDLLKILNLSKRPNTPDFSDDDYNKALLAFYNLLRNNGGYKGELTADDAQIIESSFLKSGQLKEKKINTILELVTHKDLSGNEKALKFYYRTLKDRLLPELRKSRIAGSLTRVAKLLEDHSVLISAANISTGTAIEGDKLSNLLIKY